jgi:hypothetical protein
MRDMKEQCPNCNRWFNLTDILENNEWLKSHGYGNNCKEYRFVVVATLADRDGEFTESTTVMAGDIGQARKMAREFAEAQATEHHCKYRDYFVDGDYEF